MLLLVALDFSTLYLFNLLFNLISGNKLDKWSALFFSNFFQSSKHFLFFFTLISISLRFLLYRINLISQNRIVEDTYGYYFNKLFLGLLKSNNEIKKKLDPDIVNNLLLKDLRVFSQTYILLGLDLVLQYFTLFVFIISLALTNIIFFIGIIIFGFLVIIISRYYKSINISNGKELLELDSLMSASILESNNNSKSVFVNNEILNYHIEKNSTLFKKIKTALSKINLNSSMTQKIVESLILISFSVLLYIISMNLFSFNEFIFVSIIIIRIMPILNRINAATSKINNSENIANYLYEKFILSPFLLSFPKEIKINKDIIIRNIIIKLSERKKIHIDNYQFNIGESYFLSGKSGSGKTTFIDYLVGFRGKKNISISIDSSSNWVDEYKHINTIYLEQKMTLFTGGILENICLGRDFNFHLFITIIELVGLENVFKERGVYKNDGDIFDTDASVFSGGEVQRILIARALYNMDCLLIFDEATNALDNDSEQIIIKNILSFVRERKGIVIFISHNHSVMNLFDNIIDFNNITKIINNDSK